MGENYSYMTELIICKSGKDLLNVNNCCGTN